MPSHFSRNSNSLDIHSKSLSQSKRDLGARTILTTRHTHHKHIVPLASLAKPDSKKAGMTEEDFDRDWWQSKK